MKRDFYDIENILGWDLKEGIEKQWLWHSVTEHTGLYEG